MEFTTYIKVTPKVKDILSSVIGQMSDGIWENTRSMEKYWRSLDFKTDANGYLVIIDRHGVTSDPIEFMANKIKQIIKIEIDDGANLRWERTCSRIPDYISRSSSNPITVGDCYKLYEQLKGRPTSNKYYSTYQSYTAKLVVGNEVLELNVNALNVTDAKKKAAEMIADSLKIDLI